MSQPSDSFVPTALTGLFLSIRPGSISAGTTTVSVAGVKFALTASSTNYVYLDTSDNTIKKSTSAFPVSNTLPIATVVTNIDSITSLIDSRPDYFLGNSALQGGVSSLASADSSIAVSASTGAVDLSLNIVALAKGGTHADLSATGGAVATTGKQVLKQGADHVIGVAALIATDIPDLTAVYDAAGLAAGVSALLPVYGARKIVSLIQGTGCTLTDDGAGHVTITVP